MWRELFVEGFVTNGCVAVISSVQLLVAYDTVLPAAYNSRASYYYREGYCSYRPIALSRDSPGKPYHTGTVLARYV